MGCPDGGRAFGFDEAVAVEKSTIGAVVAAAAERVAVRKSGPASPTTTLAGIAMQRDMVTVFNVGDSRVYSLSPVFSRQLTEDHQSVTNRRAINRFLGGSAAHALPAMSSARLSPDSWFLLASDGVYAFVEPKDLDGIDLSASNSSIAALVRLALANGSDDNLSAVLASVREA